MTRSTYKLPYTARSLNSSGSLKRLAAASSELQKAALPSAFTARESFAPVAKPGVNDDKQKKLSGKYSNLYQRSSTIVPEMIGNSVKIHAGHRFVKFIITEHTIGYKFGEFAPTKKRAIYKKKKKR